MEYESIPLEVRFDKDDPRTFTARVLNYGVVDSKGTSWAPGVFTRSLEAALPKAVWSHDWQKPIGKVTSYRDSADGLDVTVQLADFKRVPDADMAHSLLEDGIIDQFSFGFYRSKDEPDPNHKGATMITEATMKEVSPVLVGSVPGTRTLAVRAADGSVDVIEEQVIEPPAVEPAVDITETRTAMDAALALLEDGQTDQAAGLLTLIADGILTGERAALIEAPDPELEARAAELEDRLSTIGRRRPLA